MRRLCACKASDDDSCTSCGARATPRDITWESLPTSLHGDVLGEIQPCRVWDGRCRRTNVSINRALDSWWRRTDTCSRLPAAVVLRNREDTPFERGGRQDYFGAH